MDFTVSIDTFDGPLDLMLHLIKEGDLDLFNLDIDKLADQYISYIHSLQQLHLDIASDYLVQLATLVEYKSKKLLPDNKDEIEDGYEEDNTERLVERLIEYQRYKQLSQQLDSLRLQREEMFDKPMSEIAVEWNKANEIDKGNPYSLIKAMERLLERFREEQPYEVTVKPKELTMDDRIKQLKIHIRNWPDTFTLEDTMRDCRDVYMVVVTFIAILSMINTNILTFSEKGETIYFKKGVKYE